MLVESVGTNRRGFFLGPGLPLCFAPPSDGEGADLLTPILGLPFFFPPSADGGTRELASVAERRGVELASDDLSAESLSGATIVGVWATLADGVDTSSFWSAVSGNRPSMSAGRRRVTTFEFFLADDLDLVFGVDDIMVGVDIVMNGVREEGRRGQEWRSFAPVGLLGSTWRLCDGVTKKIPRRVCLAGGMIRVNRIIMVVSDEVVGGRFVCKRDGG